MEDENKQEPTEEKRLQKRTGYKSDNTTRKDKSKFVGESRKIQKRLRQVEIIQTKQDIPK